MRQVTCQADASNAVCSLQGCLHTQLGNKHDKMGDERCALVVHMVKHLQGSIIHKVVGTVGQWGCSWCAVEHAGSAVRGRRVIQVKG